MTGEGQVTLVPSHRPSTQKPVLHSVVTRAGTAVRAVFPNVVVRGGHGLVADHEGASAAEEDELSPRAALSYATA